MSSKEENLPASSGVQELIDRIRDDGVRSGQEEADRILQSAREEAATLVAAAKAEAEEMLEQARGQIESEKMAAEESIRLAARDTIKELGEGVRSAFEKQMLRLVGREMEDRKFLRKVILALAGKASKDSYDDDEAIKILIGSETVEGDAETEERLRKFILSMSDESLREGISFHLDSNAKSRVSVQIVDDDLKIDFDDETVAGFLVRHLLPRYRKILNEDE